MFYSIGSSVVRCNELRSQGKSIVLATGFFDLLHAEHSNFLRKAKAAGDILVVAVESDERARELKGEGRPIEPQTTRCQKVAEYADLVIALDANFNNPVSFESLMAAVQPAVYAVSSHTTHLAMKRQLTEKYGGRLEVVHDWNPSISTTKQLQ